MKQESKKDTTKLKALSHSEVQNVGRLTYVDAFAVSTSKHFIRSYVTLFAAFIMFSVAYPGIFFGGGGQQIQLTERTGIWGCSPLFGGSGDSCNLVQEI